MKSPNAIQQFPLSRQSTPRRFSWLFERVDSEKSLLHVGCADAPVSVEALESGTHVHAMLLNLAPDAVGLDVDKAGLAAIRRRFPDAILVEGSATDSNLDVGKFDQVVATEVVEHISDQESFFKFLLYCLEPGGTLLLTTPNAFCLRKVLYAAFGQERVHPDHVLYHSERTLTKLLAESGLTVEEVAYYGVDGGKLTRLTERLLQYLAPSLRAGIAVLARKPM